jgi:hypothetical protein
MVRGNAQMTVLVGVARLWRRNSLPIRLFAAGERPFLRAVGGEAVVRWVGVLRRHCLSFAGFADRYIR